MHPYEVAQTLRARAKHESIRLNYGSLYGVVEALERRQLIHARETVRAGRRPERTIYEITDAGLRELAERHPSVGEVRGVGMFWALELVRDRETREPLVPYNPAGEANAPMAAFAAAAKAHGLWPFVNMNRTHVVPPCNISELDAKAGLAALDAALDAADAHVA